MFNFLYPQDFYSDQVNLTNALRFTGNLTDNRRNAK